MITSLIIDHCTTNNIITPEQAGGKQGSWGCTDQLLIKKMILDEAKQHRCNLLIMWFKYKKAFDSVPQDWILKALELDQVQLDLLQIRLLSLHPTTVNSKFTNGHETLF